MTHEGNGIVFAKGFCKTNIYIQQYKAGNTSYESDQGRAIQENSLDVKG